MKKNKAFYFGLISVILGTQLLSSVNVLANTVNENVLAVDSNREVTNNVIKLRGRDIEAHDYRGFDVVINRQEMKLKVENVLAGRYQIHDIFGDNKYIEVRLLSPDGTNKAALKLTGNTRTDEAMKLNDTSFEYGDIIRVYHAETPRCIFEGNIINASGVTKDEYLYRITESGLEEVVAPKYTNEIKLEGVIGDYEPPSFKIKFDIVEEDYKRIKIDDIKYGTIGIHEGFHDNKYIEVKLYDKNGVQKHETLTLNGNTPVSEAMKLNDKSFEYGDYIKIYHREKWRYNVEGDAINKIEVSGDEFLYRITENGLEQISQEKNVIKLRGRDIEAHDYKGFDVVINRQEMKLKVENVLAGRYQIHSIFGDNKYIEVRLLSPDGTNKAALKLTGNTRTDEAMKLNDTSFEYGDIIRVYHAETPRCTFEGKVSNITEGTKDEYLYRITESGLEEVVAPKYTNEIELKGVLSNTSTPSFKIKFDIVEENYKRIKIDDIKHGSRGIHEGFHDNKYIEVKLYDKNGVQKHETLTLNGNTPVSEAMKLNDKSFEYGDYIKIYHEEKWRYNVEGDVINKMEVSGKEFLYRITENGLKQISQEEGPNVVKLRGLGVQDLIYKGFDVKLDKEEMKLKIENMLGHGYPIHRIFGNNKYIEIKLLDSNGTIKNSVLLTGNTRTDEAMKLNDTSFEYGDILEIYHEEGFAVNRYDVTGTVVDKNSDKANRYIISKMGLIQVQ